MCLGVPGEVIEIDDSRDLLMGKVKFGGIAKEICLAYVPESEIGDFVIVHAGFAIGKLDRDEAERVFEYINEIENLELQL